MSTVSRRSAFKLAAGLAAATALPDSVWAQAARTRLRMTWWGGTDRAKVRDALAATRAWQGVGGVFNFSKDRHSGLAKVDLVLLSYRDGAFRLADYK